MESVQVDDDSYVRVSEVLARIEKAPKARMFMGFIENPGGGPHRNPSSQWYVPPEEWPSETYPPWAHGAGYVISQVHMLSLSDKTGLRSRHTRNPHLRYSTQAPRPALC